MWWLTLGTAAASALLVVRMAWLHQARLFPGLTFYLFQHLFWGVALLIIPRTSQSYVTVYLVSNPVEWLSALWCTISLLDKAFAAYPGIRTLSRWTTWGAAVVSVGVAMALARAFWVASAGRRLFYFEVADRSVLLSLALVVILTLTFLSRFPLRLKGNTWASLIGFSAVILSLAGARLLDSLAPHLAAGWADNLELVAETAVYLAWAMKLRAEEAQAPARVIFQHADEAELLRKLDAMNGILRRAGRG